MSAWATKPLPSGKQKLSLTEMNQKEMSPGKKTATSSMSFL